LASAGSELLTHTPEEEKSEVVIKSSEWNGTTNSELLTYVPEEEKSSEWDITTNITNQKFAKVEVRAGNKILIKWRNNWGFSEQQTCTLSFAV